MSAYTYLETLCDTIPTRHVGSAGNQQATDFVAETFRSFGFDVECPAFQCFDWSDIGSTLTASGRHFTIHTGPYSLPVNVQVPLVAASTIDELAALDAQDKVLLLYGAITEEQLMPKNFPFYNSVEHQELIRLLEDSGAAAIVTATGRHPDMAGAMYPFPMIEDGDFKLPSVYMTDVEGMGLLDNVGQQVSLCIDTTRTPSTGCNVVARKRRDFSKRIVITAHIDAKASTSGAIDNAAGVTTLLLLAELLADYDGQTGIELVAINGEDYYNAPGEQLFMDQNAGKFGDIMLGINIDGAGYVDGKTAFSLYNCPDDLAAQIRASLEPSDDLIEGPQWYQSDHFMFIMNQRPALAFTSEAVLEMMRQVIHTEADTLAVVDTSKLTALTEAIQKVLVSLIQ